jgi:hypothetical protein
MLDAEETGFWSLVFEEEASNASEIRISANLGIANKIVDSKAVQASSKPSKLNDVLIHRGITRKV